MHVLQVTEALVGALTFKQPVGIATQYPSLVKANPETQAEQVFEVGQLAQF